MKFFMRMFLIMAYVFVPNGIISMQNPYASLLSIIVANQPVDPTVNINSMFVASGPYNNLPTVASAITNTVSLSAVPQNFLQIKGSLSFSGNDVVINLQNNIQDLQISGNPVTLTIPVEGSCSILIADVPYSNSIPGLTIKNINDAGVFAIDSSVLVFGEFNQNALSVTIGENLSITALESGTYVEIDTDSVLTANQDIVMQGALQGNIVVNGTINSTNGNILLYDNFGSSSEGVYINGTIQTGAHKSFISKNNQSQSTNGMLFDSSAIIEVGSASFIYNQGSSVNDFYGVKVLGALYTNNLQIIMTCVLGSGSFFINTNVYTYNDHAVQLSNSAMTITGGSHCFVYGGSLSTTDGEMHISGNDVAITGSDISVTGIVIVTVAPSGSMTLNGSTYDGTIPGLLLMKNNNNQTVNMQGQFLGAAFHANGANVTMVDGLRATGDVSVSYANGSGILTIPSEAALFLINGNVTFSSGAQLQLGQHVHAVFIDGSVLGAGIFILQTGLGVAGSVSVASLEIHDGFYSGGGIATSGPVNVVNGQIAAFGSGFHVTNGDVMIGSTASFYMGSGGTSISGIGNFVIEDGAGIFYTGATYVESGNFTAGTGSDFLDFSGGVLSVGGQITLNRNASIGSDLRGVGLTLGDGVSVSAAGGIIITGGSISIGSGASLAGAILEYDGQGHVGSFFSNLGTLTTTSGEMTILNANNNQGEAVVTGILVAAGSLTINSHTCSTRLYAAVDISGAISGVDIRIDGNTSGENSDAVFGFDQSITATGLLQLNNNSSSAGGCAVFFEGMAINVASTIEMKDNNAGDGSSVGIYLNSAITTISTITMNNNIGTVFGVRVAGGSIKTDGTFTIQIDDDSLQFFKSSAVTIQKTNNDNVPFSDFAVSVGSTTYTSYGDIPAHRVVLASANQV